MLHGCDVLVVFEADLRAAPHVRLCVEEVRSAGVPIVVEDAEFDGVPAMPCRLHLAGALSFFTSSGAALVIASASEPCECFSLDLARLDFLGLRGCEALLAGTRGIRANGGTVLIEHPSPAVRRVLRRGLAGVRHVSVS